MAKRKITVVLVDRANYGRLKPVMQELAAAPDIEVSVICAGSMLLDRFGSAVDLVRADGFTVDEEVYLEIEGSIPMTMAKSIGLGIIEFSSALAKVRSDFVLLIGDRYEAFAAAIAASFQNRCVIHVQGGEVSGSIDESTRHAITKLAHYHFPSTQRSGDYLVRMGEDPATVFTLGCPSADVVATAMESAPVEELRRLGVGPEIDFTKPYVLTLFHPVTTEYDRGEEQMDELLAALSASGMQTILLWPNIDAGSDRVAQAVRRFRENHRDAPLHAYKNFEPEVYIPLLGHAACLVGNSSSFVRDASHLGTPVVLVGSRQDGREWSDAVMRVEPARDEILAAISAQVAHGRYATSDLYGRPGTAKAIIETIGRLEPYSQKRLHYASEETVS